MMLQYDYTKEELEEFAHGISLHLISLNKKGNWRFDPETARKMDWLERLYVKVREDIRCKEYLEGGGQI